MKKIIITLLIFIALAILSDLVNFRTNFSSFSIFNLGNLDFHNAPLYLGAIITGFITFWAMRFIDDENKKRWQNEFYNKRKVELILCVIEELADCLIKIATFQQIKSTVILRNTSIHFDKDYYDLFETCQKSLLKLNMFYRKNKNFDNSVFLKTQELLSIITQNFLILHEIKTQDIETSNILKEKNIIDEKYVNLLKFIDFIKEESNCSSSFKYALHLSFESDYNYDLENLNEDFLKYGLELRDELLEKCNIEEDELKTMPKEKKKEEKTA